MEAIMVPSSPDQPISSYNKHAKNPKRNTRHFISRSTENFYPPNTIQNGLLFIPPPPLHFSFPPAISLVNPKKQHEQQQKMPPLLPLPITKPSYASLPSRTRCLSCSPTNKNHTRSVRKSKPALTSPKKEDAKKEFNIKSATTKDVSECLIIASISRLGPDPNDLPKDVSGISSSSSSSVGGVITWEVLADLEKFSASVFTLSPPPSSLPLPKFPLRPKLGCNADAVGFDVGATDKLRRLLQLH